MSGPELDDHTARRLETGRVVAFTDGVFAIIITILVLDLKVPDLGSGQSLEDSVSEAWPTFVSWVISFLIVGMYWSWHRGALADVRYADLGLVWLNLLFLLPVSLIPYAASALGEHSDEPLALHLYGAVLIAATLLRLAMIWYLHRHPTLSWDAIGTREQQLSLLSSASQLVLYAAAMALAEPAPTASTVLFLLVPAVYLGLIAVLKTDARTRAAAQDLT